MPVTIISTESSYEVECYEFAAVFGEGALQLSVTTHGYRGCWTLSVGWEIDCNKNVVCPVGDPWDPQIRSVAMIVVGENGTIIIRGCIRGIK